MSAQCWRDAGASSPLSSAGPLAVLAPWPAAGPTLAFLQFLLGPANAAFSGHLLLGILDPADEFVAGQRRYVPPGIERSAVGDQRLAQVSRKLVHHPTGHSRAAHGATVQRLVSARNDYRPVMRGCGDTSAKYLRNGVGRRCRYQRAVGPGCSIGGPTGNPCWDRPEVLPVPAVRPLRKRSDSSRIAATPPST
jgi:hypothetical protein